ncbi:transposase [Fulvivirga sp. M361]|uniref:transposase n=1 Tax=Fulvivirga sp. M361 TaxID=2594266 RepID=UPI002102BDBD|nr:transposase [Fulvivirga sp. M361]
MSELKKANTDYPYFLTFTVAGWIAIFTRQRYCDIIIKSLKYCIEHKGLLLYAYVIMPSHMHLVARHDKNKLSSVIRDFKKLHCQRNNEIN